MRRFYTFFLSCALSASVSLAQEISRQEYEQLAKRIEQLEKTSLPKDNSKADSICVSSADEHKAAVGFERFRFGGYGELLGQYFDYGPNRYGGSGTGSPADNRAVLSMPRFILAFDYKFSPSWILGAEIEFEHGGTGAGIEAEYGEGVEYEYEFEKGGEVALEQFHLTKIFNKAIAIRAGHMIVPVGITNAHHEPINFFGTTRPEGESTILPCTWHETGLAILGQIKWFSYEAMIVSGLDPYGFSSENWIQAGRQTKFELIQFTNPAFAARMEFDLFKNSTRLGLSGYYTPSTAKNATNPSTTQNFKGSVGIISADLMYRAHGLTGRANFLWGHVGDAVEINKLRPNKYTGYPNTPISSTAMTGFVELGYNVGRFARKPFNLTPFARYEYCNSMQTPLTGAVAADKRNHVQLITAGINYFALPNLVIKADYSHRIIGNGAFRSENTVALGIAYIGWFIRK